jgi:primosomal protein N' (replication factor Y)
MTMRYYTVLVQSATYFGSEPLTYQHDRELIVGTLVEVPIGRRTTLGVVVSEVAKPKFTTKNITSIYDNLPPLPAELLKLAVWLPQYYPAPLGAIGQQIMPASFSAKLVAAAAEGIAAPMVSAATLPALTAEQKSVLDAMKQPDTYVLHGETGSGKTRVYIEQTLRTLQTGKSVVVLTPEIGLTSQLSAVFRATFGDRVIVMHSGLTGVERQKAWLKCLFATEPVIVIGPRSALFAPLKSIGLIVIDEFHEPAYKQDQAPHYHAVRVGSMLANLHGATLLLGSATPPVVDYYLAEQRGKPILRMSQSARSTSGHNLHTHIIDLKERANFNRSPHISDALIKAIEKALGSGEQSLLYLNRRGSARLVLCNACGWQALCPHCDLPLTYHSDNHLLMCHTCGFTQPTPSSCPECGNPDIIFTAIGTQALADEAQRLFPAARVQRFDTDNKKAERFEQHYDNVQAGNVDILVGTQVLAKGLDLPNLSVLGVITADTSLSMPDFSAQERTYQLLSQVLGRIGRGHRSGTAIVQTYQPESPILLSSINKDWGTYYANELEERQTFLFPPFVYLLQLTCRRAKSATAEKAAEALADVFRSARLRVTIEGPAPSFHEKIGDKYQWQLVLKSRSRAELLKAITLLPSGWSYDIDPVTLL